MPFDALGIIAPHPPIMVAAVGGADSDVTRASAHALGTAGQLLERFAPETVVIMSPHATSFSDGFAVTCSGRMHGDLGRFRAPDAALDTAGDQELADAIVVRADHAGIPAACRTPSTPLITTDPRGLMETWEPLSEKY